MAPNYATAIKIGDRYFTGFGRRDRVLTAWSLAGAWLWADDDDPRLAIVLERLRARKKDPKLVTITEEKNLR